MIALTTASPRHRTLVDDATLVGFGVGRASMAMRSLDLPDLSACSINSAI